MKTSLRFLSFLAIVFQILAVCNVNADDFFKKDFAADPLAEDPPSSASAPTESPREAPLPSPSEKSSRQEDFIESSEEKSEEQDTQVIVEDKDEGFSSVPQGEPIKSIGLIVSSAPKVHVMSALDELKKVLEELKHIEPDEITLVGPSAEEDSDILASLGPSKMKSSEANTELKLFNRVGFAPELPEYLHITHSPAWIIKTANGSYLLEGFRSPKQFINSSGQFVEQKQEVDNQ